MNNEHVEMLIKSKLDHIYITLINFFAEVEML